ncbi:hypothetical protein L228DRAFT_279952 [Xylona heveae TC161]|uniref:Rho-GAP domain-containing protein n=1 Tax=Xylona heveae (strain CBS 132557 / TC161) TaxID=1328760 RepID=A0A165JYS5_XYLHT|nr:hypothetical protein L228DRAFT_279952 [Xylona heveae TC161]KZF26798.1 hypothetical protein L228DRAFT_279952 [Xylona heveae TC161]
MPRPSKLSLSTSIGTASSKDGHLSVLSPLRPRSPGTPKSPLSPRLGTRDAADDVAKAVEDNSTSQPQSTPPESSKEIDKPSTSTSLPSSQTLQSPKHTRGQSRAFFSNFKASKSSSRIQPSEASNKQMTESQPAAKHGRDKTIQVYPSGRTLSSTPDLLQSSLLAQSEDIPENGDDRQENTSESRPAGGSAGSDTLSSYPPAEAGPVRRMKPRFTHLLTRSRSTRVDDASAKGRYPASARLLRVEDSGRALTAPETGGLKTAPLHDRDRSFRDMMHSTIRNRSADRHQSADSEDESLASSKDNKKDINSSSSYRDGSGTSFLNNIKSSSSKAADGIGKAGKGIFIKLTRSGSSHEKEIVPDDNYVCTIINLPLIEQTRRTRISKRLEISRDKTEFWMPALPWRCIDYLNLKGTEEEGLYRIPGSGPRVRAYQRRFDSELDIDLFNEEDLYDINIIGSMFKAWLRELPDEIFPKATQAKIAEQCAGATKTPQMLKDELSRLPPYNYYLLFAITCHISLLHAHADQNKMDYRNLCICFQPCMKIDGFCFQFLVCDWKNCWQGCWTEKEALAEEYRLAELAKAPSSAGTATTSTDERSLSSSDSAKLPAQNASGKPRAEQQESSHGASETPQTPSKKSEHTRTNSRLPELSPVKPLSPIGI